MVIAHAGKAVFLAGLLVGALAAVGALSHRPGLDMSATASIAPAARLEDSFRLVSAAGEAGECRISAARVRDGARRPLRLSTGCAAGNPELSAARYWLDRPDGTVALSGDNGRTLAVFAPGDGAAYESYEPSYPVMTLIALN